VARLNEAQKRELCWFIAARKTTAEIAQHFLEKYSIEVTPQQVYSYKNGLNSKKWPKLIEEMRDRYDRAVDECHFSSKRNRLDALLKAYEVAEGKGDARGMVMAVAQAQKEMEGTKLQITGKNGEDFQFNINIGPPPEDQKPREVAPPVRLIPPRND